MIKPPLISIKYEPEKQALESWLSLLWQGYNPCTYPLVIQHCNTCGKVTEHMVCDNCSRVFCLKHCEYDDEADWEMYYRSYKVPICYRCEEPYEEDHA